MLMKRIMHFFSFLRNLFTKRRSRSKLYEAPVNQHSQTSSDPEERQSLSGDANAEEIKDFLTSVPSQCHFYKLSFETIWVRSRRIYRGHQEALTAASEELRQQADAGTIAITDVGKDILEFVKANESANQNQDRVLLLEAINLMAAYKVDDRETVRNILTRLYGYSRHIDRAILLFEYCDHQGVSDHSLTDEIKAKRAYILDNIAGWVVTENEFPAGSFSTIGAAENYYIDLPFRQSCKAINTHVMAEALYRLTDADFVLELLRHGIFPSCLYLWPVAVMLDLKFAFHQLKDGSLSELHDMKEAKMIRYFCRARSNFYIHFIKSDDDEREKSFRQIPPDIGYDNTLLLPPKAEILVPEDRYRDPARLEHQARLAIRKAITKADCLPKGIYQLPLPNILKHYVDLRID